MSGKKVVSSQPSSATVIACHEPSSNTAAVVTLADPASDKQCWVVSGFSWSYDGAPTAGSVTITDGTTPYKIDITAAGPGFVVFGTPKKFAPNTAVTGTLAAGGSGVSGIINLDAYIEAIP